MNPLPTIRVTFNIHLSPADLMTTSDVEHVKVPMRRPRRRLFGGSLADLCAAWSDDVEARSCDGSHSQHDDGHEWTERADPNKSTTSQDSLLLAGSADAQIVARKLKRSRHFYAPHKAKIPQIVLKRGRGCYAHRSNSQKRQIYGATRR